HCQHENGLNSPHCQHENGLNSPRSMQHIFMKRPSVRVTLLIISLAAAIAVVIGALVHEAARRKLREAILAALQPVALKNCTLKRFGSANDGGYLMCENLIEPLDAAYSYGVGTNDDWGGEVSRRYHVPVHQYDCFDPARPTCYGGTFVFHDECVGDRTGYRESDRKSTRLNSSHVAISYAVFCLKKKK